MRRVPGSLLDSFRTGTATPARLLRITLVNGDVYGMTTLDRDITYQGLTYSALRGFNSSIIASDAGMSVDNAEAEILMSTNVDGVTLERVARGDLDDASWEMMLVNWADLSLGHVVLDAGDLGEVKVIDGLIYVPELLSYVMRLRQAVGGVWSRRCRAEFGTPAEGQRGCGVDTSGMWVAGTVTAVDSDDPFRVFGATGLIEGNFFPGRVRWTSGNNAGRRINQIEAFSSTSGTVALFDALVFPAAVGDTFEIRRDCNKSPSDCIAYGNFLNYKGEPFIPVGDGLETMVPSAQVFGGLSGSTIED